MFQLLDRHRKWNCSRKRTTGCGYEDKFAPGLLYSVLRLGSVVTGASNEAYKNAAGEHYAGK